MHEAKMFLIGMVLAATAWLSPTAAATEPATPAGQEIASEIRSGVLRALIEEFPEKENIPAFWQAVQSLSDTGEYPIVEEIDNPDDYLPNYVRLTFLHREGSTPPENVLLFANINRVVTSELLFEKIDQSDIYFKTVEVPRGVRFQYRIIENDPLTGLFAAAKYGTRMHLLRGDPDPFNPNKLVYPDAFGEGDDYIKTWVELPGATPQPYIADKGNPRGKLTTEERESTLLGYSREISTFLPPDYDPANAYPLMILLDGSSYYSRGPLQLTLENLIADESIPSLVVLAIDAGVKDGQTQRNDEFTCSPRFMEFLNDELLPWFTSTYSVSPDPNQRIIAGSSFGGLFATYFAFNHPETASHVLSQSGSFHWGAGSFDFGGKENEARFEWLVREFAFAKKKPITIYMEVGVLEGEYSWSDPEFPHQIVSHRHFKTILDMKGYDVNYQVYQGGHEMLSWRGGMADGLKHLCQSMN